MKRTSSPLTELCKRKLVQEIICLEATETEQVVYLNESKKSWIKLTRLGDEGFSMDEFEEVWALKPDERLKIKIAGKIVTCPRFTKSFLKSYKFSGLDHEADLNVPKPVAKLLEAFKKDNQDLNQSLVNWYERDGSIGKHSDDVLSLKLNSDIYSASFGPAVCYFILEPKYGNGPKYRIKLDHNTLLVMGGACQSTHVHSVPKIKNQTNNRLNVTFRCFR